MDLIDAVTCGNAAAVAELLQDGADPNYRDKFGEHALFLAALEGHVDVVSLLLNAGASVDMTTSGGATALMASPGVGSVELVQLLLARGANVNHSTMHGTALTASVERDRDDLVDVLLAAGARVNIQYTPYEVSPILVAAHKGSVAIAQRLLQSGANLLSVDKDGHGVVSYAAMGGHTDMIRFLVQKGANPSATSIARGTPLISACGWGQLAAVVALLQAGATVNQSDAEPCLHVAASNGHSAIVALLLKAGADHGGTALYAAARSGHSDIVRQLAYAKAQLDKPARDGSTPVIVARCNQHASVLEVLHDVRTKKMELLHAVRHGHLAAVRALLAEGLSVNETDEHGNTLVHLALLGRHEALLAELLTDPAVDTSGVNKFGESPKAIVTKMDVPSLIEQLHNIQSKPPMQVPAVSTVHLRELGRGSYGIVVKGSLQGQDVAIKELWNSHVGAASLQAEMQILIDNPSPYLVRLVATADAASDAPQLFFEYMDGGNLTSYLEKITADDTAGLRVIEKLAVPLCIEAAVAPDVPTIPSRVGRSQRPLSHDEELHVAVETGNADDVRALLASGVHPDSTSITGETPLKKAVGLRDSHLVDMLLTYHANVNHANAMGMTALHDAATRSASDILLMLLRGPNVSVDARTIKQQTPLHVAVAAGQLANVVALADAGADCEATDANSYRPLHYAALKGHPGIAAFLLQREASTSARNKHGDTVLHVAILNEHSDVATLLVEAGADVHAVSNEQSPLHVACERGVAAVVPALLARGANVNAHYRGSSPLFLAMIHNHADVVNMLLASPDLDLNERSQDGLTALHVATIGDKLAIAKTLLHAGADVDAKATAWGLCAMDFAIKKKSRAMVDVLQPAYHHKRALLQAMHQQNEPHFAALLEAPYSCNVNDEIGCSLVHLAVLANNEVMLDLLLSTPRVLFDTTNHEHKTPLAIAIERGCASMAQKLFDRVHAAAVEIASSECDVTSHELGRGGFGVVFLGSYRGAKVAVKTVTNINHLQSLHAEVDGLLACPSPYLVRLVAIADRHSETPALLLEYMEGGSLRSHLEKKQLGRRTSEHVTALHAAWVVANALNDLHAKKIVHRDIKSDNVLLSSSDEVKLGDLGLARCEATVMTDAPGTRFWMAPEVLCANGTKYGLPADIYAFGVLLTELNTCQLPYFDQDVQDPIAFVNSVVNGSLRPSLTPDCEPWLRELADMCLRGDPADRPTAHDIVQRLRNEMATLPPPDTSVEYAYLRAAAKDDVDAVSELLTSGVPLDWTLPGGASLLLAATTARATGTVKLLLDHGANVNDVSGGRTPLHEAVAIFSEHLQHILIDAGADVEARDKEGNTPLAVASSKMPVEACIKRLVATGATVGTLPEDDTRDIQLMPDTAVHGDPLRVLTLSASRQENAACPEIFCGLCAHWHPVDEVCGACGHDASAIDRAVSVVRRLMRLHYRGNAVDWNKKCSTCRQMSLTIFDERCPECGHQQEAETEIKLLKIVHARLKKALKATRVAYDEPAIPRSVRRWLARMSDPPADRRPPTAPSMAKAKQKRSGEADTSQASAGVNLCGIELLPPPTSVRQFEDTVAPRAAASSKGQSALARRLFTSTRAPVLTISADHLPEPGATGTVDGRVVVHRHVGDDDPLDAIRRCTSPFIEPIVAAALPTSVFVEVTKALRLQQVLQAPHAREDMQHAGALKLHMIYAVANALVDLHDVGLVHGHLSSHNVIFSPRNFIQICVPGTSATDDALLAWTAPEVLAGDAPPSSASDIYAFGILLTEFDTFAEPFADYDFDDEVALAVAVVDGDLRPTLRDDCQVWYRNLVGLCLDTDPLNRPTAADLVELFQHFIDDTMVLT
ncbi:TKL protein kinase [Saprolegnia diclina VS20]|uniref:TKL protein kinase n=1 Tax=Saprolegnia diclina (strain VS20) TaxID=1156394 RepID=T0QEB9_SAPDV|nr:TKL protein kinase [Saprolegnia diclina VS20]EQC31905.1 TKL protein kinase [Saprolegnia diclina VS20]|eukprot:XP_008614633.1 TKL protein kinase [Saprolegnia diclina VS20]